MEEDASRFNRNPELAPGKGSGRHPPSSRCSQSRLVYGLRHFLSVDRMPMEPSLILLLNCRYRDTGFHQRWDLDSDNSIRIVGSFGSCEIPGERWCGPFGGRPRGSAPGLATGFRLPPPPFFLGWFNARPFILIFLYSESLFKLAGIWKENASAELHLDEGG